MADEYDIDQLLEKSFGKEDRKGRREDDSEAYNEERQVKRRSKHEEKRKKRRHAEESEHEVDEDKRRRSDKVRIEEEVSPFEGGSNGDVRFHKKHRHSSPQRRRREELGRFDSPPRRHKSRSRSRHRERNRRSREVVRPEERFGDRSRERNGERTQKRQKSPSPKASELNPEQRDLRTIFCMQLSTRLQKGDLLDFFTKVGKVRDVHLIRDSKSHRSKGIAYIEFYEIESASRALEMSGSKLDGIPIIVQPSHGERNRSNMTITTATGKPGYMGPMKLYVGSLHYNITEDMLRGIFEPFGPIDELKIMRDHQTGRSAGFGFLQFRHGEDGKRALEQLNGFELAGRPIKLGSVADYQINQNSSLFDIDESDKVGFGMSATGRIQLMAKLAEGTGFQIPAAAANVLQSVPAGLAGQLQQTASSPPISTQCFILSNMFSHDEHMDDNWERELKDEVIEECAKHGGVLHVHVDRHSRDGNIYVKCATIASAMTSVASLHGRFFAGKQITASYVPLPNYHNLFPDAVKATQPLSPSTGSKSAVPYSY